MKPWLLVSLIALPYAFAQSTDDVLNSVCGAQDLAWVCEARALVASTQAIAEDILTDFQAFAESNFEQYVQEGLEYAATQLGAGDVTAFVDDINTAVREGPEALGATLQVRLDEVRRAAFADTPNNYEPSISRSGGRFLLHEVRHMIFRNAKLNSMIHRSSEKRSAQSSRFCFNANWHQNWR